MAGGLTVDLERQQGGPDGHPADEVLRPVDRIENPAPGAAAGIALLLAEHGVTGPLGAEPLAYQRLGGQIGIADGCGVRFRIDLQVQRLVAIGRETVHLVGDRERQTEV